MDLVALLQAAQDRDRVLDGRLIDVDRLEAPLERRVLLDTLLVLVERRGADTAKLAAREGRLEQVRGVHRAFGSAGSDDRVDLVDEEDDLTGGRLDLLEDRLQPILELAAELRSGDESAHVERDEALVLERLGHVALDDALGDSFDDRRLADARLADEHRIVLRAPREDLHHATNLLVATDDGIDLALASGLGEVTAILLERQELPLGLAIRDALGSSHGRERRQQLVVGDAAGGHHGGLHLAIVLGEREEEVLDGDEIVLERLRFVLRTTDDLHRPARERRLGAAGHARELRNVLVDTTEERVGVASGLDEDWKGDSTLLLEHRLDEVLRRDLRITSTASEIRCGAERLLALRRHPIGTHRQTLPSSPDPRT